MPASSIPDDGTLEAALYGSAHIETVLAKENGTKLMQVFNERIESVLSSLDLELAAIILSEAPQLVQSDEPLHPQAWPHDVIDTVYSLRYLVRQILGGRLVESWMDGAEHRGRLIGLGEHSARASVSGSADSDYKKAVLRGGPV